MTLSELIAALEAADGPRLDLEVEIFCAIDPRWTPYGVGSVWRDSPDGPQSRSVPPYTSSLDAALTLVPEGWSWHVRRYDQAVSTATLCSAPSVGRAANGHADTPAHALCIAALKARKAKE